MDSLADQGAAEDGWDAIEHAIAEYDLREGAVPVFVLMQNGDGRTDVNQSLIHEGVLAALQSKNVLLNVMVVGMTVNDNKEPLFDLAPYAVSTGDFTNRRVLGVEANDVDGTADGMHDYYLANTSTGALVTTLPATEIDALQISYGGSNTGPSGMVGSGKSVLIGQDIVGGIGGTDSGEYRAISIPFEYFDMTGATVHNPTSALSYAFDYFGARTQLWINQNGTISFNQANTISQMELSSAAGNRPNYPLIAAMWDTFWPTGSYPTDEGLRIYQKQVDVDQDSELDLVVEWRDYAYTEDVASNGFDRVNFQAVLYANGRIGMNYLDVDTNDRAAHEQTGGISATVGLWSGTPEAISLPAGKFVPGPHDINGTTNNATFSSYNNTSDNYVRLAWETGGAAWAFDIVEEFGATSNIAVALKDTFVASLSNQILEAAADGKVYQELIPVVELNVGGNAVDDYDADGPYAPDFSEVITAPSGMDIDVNTNSLPSNATLNDFKTLFKSARTPGSDFLQLRSGNGIESGAQNFIGSNKSVLISTTATPGVGPSDYGYSAQQVTAASESFTSGRQTIMEGGFGGSELLDFDNTSVGDFSFSYFGKTYDQLRIHLDGFITLGQSQGQEDAANPDWTQAPPVEPTIAALWDDLAAYASDGKVYWEVLGSGSNKRLVVQWDQLTYEFESNPTNTITFQAVLYEDGRIRFNYMDLSSSGSSNGDGSTVGIGHAFSDFNWSFGTLPAGEYVVELFFADFQTNVDHTRHFDIVLEGATVLNDYNISKDYARIVPFSSDELNTATAAGSSSIAPAGVVKRFAVEVDNNGLQIDLLGRGQSSYGVPAAPPIINGLRILQSEQDSIPPTITDVLVYGDGWTRAPYSMAALTALGNQLRSLPTVGIDRIEVYFSEPITVIDASLFTLKGHNNRNIPLTYLGLDTTSTIATFSFDALWADKYALHIKDDAINDLSGNRLDGDWAAINQDGGTPDAVGDDPAVPFAIGDGTQGSEHGEFRLHFAHLPGDYDGNGSVGGDDFNLLHAQDPSTDGDGDGDHLGTGGDLLVWQIYFGYYRESVHQAVDLNNDTTLETGELDIWDATSIRADFNDDEIVDRCDFEIMRSNFYQYVTGNLYSQGDTNYGGFIGANDFLTTQSNYGEKTAWYIDDSDSNLLTVGLPPQVLNLIISGSNSLHDPFAFDTVDGSGSQLNSVPVGGADTISIVFSENVNVSAESLFLIGLSTANLPAIAEFSYDAVTCTATWRFEGWALRDNYLLYLSDSITDVDGNFLDGEWTNPESISTTNSAVSTFPSGDGDSGGAFIFTMTLLPGDANIDGVVDNYDLNYVLNNFFGPWGQLFSTGDFNGDGYVDTYDLNDALNNFFVDLQEPWILADLDEDGDVDDDDLAIIGTNYGSTTAVWEDGDLTGDGVIDDFDLELAFAQYGIVLLNTVA